MRYNQRVRLCRDEKKHYDSDLGRMVSEKKIVAEIPCFISPVRVELLNAFGSKLNQSSLVVHVREYREKVDSLELEGRPFTIVKTPIHRNGRTIFYVSEALNG
ncbi:hypothetical protein BVE84_05500 [Streptococcus azizii]|uniref:Phage head-tail adapter protein n=1 Tax=Streptococcus azizii TaxID=1579424 RepID=A0AB36JP58_9STRE|nr:MULTISPECIES: hypothetical protein [Streptococcus]MBF0775962.1 hypothetical protein [Streptococcus sp. 19428wD3_AN2]MBF0788187.1 hypothetical protein [Streptococcus sp. 19428wC2_LYSM12]ONK26299.1 hypothetical protein BVE86_07440 [Streptococcus azizii]ONK28216.1 hypothetical protein BVE85_05225 [Streptococcus azizii]ONK29046.1 hypothetical protein BVE84_05500 [Streptococcus azizii]